MKLNINYLFDMDDLKLKAKNNNNLEGLKTAEKIKWRHRDAILSRQKYESHI